MNDKILICEPHDVAHAEYARIVEQALGELILGPNLMRSHGQLFGSVWANAADALNFDSMRQEMQHVIENQVMSQLVAFLLLGPLAKVTNRSPKRLARLRHSMTQTALSQYRNAFKVE